MVKTICFALATITAICAALPVEKLPVLQPLPSEAYYKVSKKAEPFSLKCSVTGEGSSVKFQWHKDGKILDADNTNIVQRKGKITILKPSDADAGKYQCFAVSDAGVASSSVVDVQKTYIKSPKYETKTHKPIEGKPFKLDCTIPDANPKPEITWLYQSIAFPTIFKEVLDLRILASPEGDLYFTNITQNDASNKFKYTCVAESPVTHEKVVLAEHILEEAVASDDQGNEITDEYVSKDVTAKYGDVTMIYCIFGGTPLVIPRWFRNGVDVTGKPGDRVTAYNRSTGRRLLIRETWLEDAGPYKCVGNNEVGKPREHVINLTVVAAPHSLEMPSSVTPAKSGQDVTIPCQIYGVPAPKLTWSFNSKPLTPSDRISINQSTNGNLTIADVTIKSVQNSDKGYYGCNGANEYGNIYSETLLNVA